MSILVLNKLTHSNFHNLLLFNSIQTTMAREATAFFDIAGIGWSQAVAPFLTEGSSDTTCFNVKVSCYITYNRLHHKVTMVILDHCCNKLQNSLKRSNTILCSLKQHVNVSCLDIS